MNKTHKKSSTTKHTKQAIIIAGPCAAEDISQIRASIKEAKKRHVDFLRISLWKPRTKPGFDGVGEEGIDFLVEAAKNGVNPGTEVILPEHAEKVMEKVLKATTKGKVLLWIGARNQNHYIQQEIAKVVARDKRAVLMVKNQPWPSLDHWEGIVEHVLAGGIDRENLLICHRGFAPTGHNPQNLRNIPDYAMTQLMKNKYKVPMIFDPSHTGGSVEKVIEISKESAQHGFDGIIVEVHPNPKVAKTDAKQQLTWEQFDMLTEYVS